MVELSNCKRVSKHQRGFTLAELLAVVIIMGVLAALATYGVTKYVRTAKSTEAIGMIGDIKAAEEIYRGEMYEYLGSSTFTNWHPSDTPGNFKRDWHTDNGSMSDTFRTLGVESDSPTYFTYTVVAGAQTDSVPTPPTEVKTDFGFPDTANEPFYIVVARGDLDGDGVFSYAMGHSFSSEIYTEREHE